LEGLGIGGVDFPLVPLLKAALSEANDPFRFARGGGSKRNDCNEVSDSPRAWPRVGGENIPLPLGFANIPAPPPLPVLLLAGPLLKPGPVIGAAASSDGPPEKELPPWVGKANGAD
jgi:hypothetical protein